MATVALPTGEERLWLGAFGERWFQTLCSVAGCSTARPEPDRTGTDLVVQDQAHESIRFQVKATLSPTVVGRSFRFPLDVRTYDRLRQGSAPGHLALLVVLDQHPRWAGFCHRGSIVRAAMYWTRIAGLPATSNLRSVSLSLPFANMFTPEVLLGLFPKGGDTRGALGRPS